MNNLTKNILTVAGAIVAIVQCILIMFLSGTVPVYVAILFALFFAGGGIVYTISYRYHRKGYAYEALHALTEKLHTDYPDWDFVCFTERENFASMELLKKLGYEYIGYAPKITSEVFGKWMKPDARKKIEEAAQKQN